MGFGFEVTVVERARGLRPRGHAIDVRGVAVEVLKNMGLYEAACARRTHMLGSSVLDADGKEVWRSEERSFSGGRFDNEDIEVFRDDLVRLMYEAAQDDVEYLLRINLGFALPSPDAWRGRPAAQKALVAACCAHMRWQIPRLLEAMRRSTDFYFGDVAQVKMPNWCSGRVALLGDAAYCPSPFSGQGTSLALVGACVLAKELLRAGGEIGSAFERYESRMRPYVELNQALVDLDRAGPTPDDLMDAAKNGISLDRWNDGSPRAPDAGRWSR